MAWGGSGFLRQGYYAAAHASWCQTKGGHGSSLMMGGRSIPTMSKKDIKGGLRELYRSRVEVATWRLLCSSFLAMASFLLGVTICYLKVVNYIGASG